MNECGQVIISRICVILLQVFKAETKDGTIVAVKAQYIDLQDRFAGDVATVQFLLKISGFIFPKFDMEWVLIVSFACDGFTIILLTLL